MNISTPRSTPANSRPPRDSAHLKESAGLHLLLPLPEIHGTLALHDQRLRPDRPRSVFGNLEERYVVAPEVLKAEHGVILHQQTGALRQGRQPTLTPRGVRREAEQHVDGVVGGAAGGGAPHALRGARAVVFGGLKVFGGRIDRGG